MPYQFILRNNRNCKAFRFLLSLILSAPVLLRAQTPTPVSYFFDENSLAKDVGTLQVADATANGGAVLMRPASAGGGTFFYGPYTSLKGGDYLVQFRLKVASNAGSSVLFNVDLVSSAGGVVHNRLEIRTDMFKNSNQWELITMPVQLADNISGYEVRGVGFSGGVTDVYLDYVNVVPGTVMNVYSDDFTISGNGNVGIGTFNPKEKLEVNGVIKSTFVSVGNTINAGAKNFVSLGSDCHGSLLLGSNIFLSS